MLSDQDRTIIHGAFQRGWQLLLRQERVTADNSAAISASLLQGILACVQAGEQNEIIVTAVGLQSIRDLTAVGQNPGKFHSSLH